MVVALSIPLVLAVDVSADVVVSTSVCTRFRSAR
jgi:hypothetical protein